MLTVRNVSFRFMGHTGWIIKDFSFHAYPGDIVAVVGESGCGKTTLLNILCGVIPKMISGKLEGDVLLNNSLIEDITLPEISQYISLLMPDPDLQLFFPIVEQELAFGPENLVLPPAEIASRIDKTMKQLDLEEIRFQETAKLSFGQKKLVALAAIMTLEPDVYLLDEPSSGLSGENIAKIVELISRLAEKNKVIFIADHNPDILGIAKKTINLSKKNNVQD